MRNTLLLWPFGYKNMLAISS